MKICEITIGNQLKDIDDPDQLNAVFRSHGWTVLGTGLEAAVAMHPSKSYVLKIFRDHSLYQDFVALVQQHQHNPHWPKFGRYVRRVPGTGWLYVRMEKLTKIGKSQLLKSYLPYLLAMVQIGVTTELDTLGHHLSDAVEDKIQDWGFDSVDLGNPEDADQIFAKAGGSPPYTWTQALEILRAHSRNFPQLDAHGWDMHAANFMRRGSTLVITDPYI